MTKRFSIDYNSRSGSFRESDDNHGNLVRRYVRAAREHGFGAAIMHDREKREMYTVWPGGRVEFQASYDA